MSDTGWATNTLPCRCRDANSTCVLPPSWLATIGPTTQADRGCHELWASWACAVVAGDQVWVTSETVGWLLLGRVVITNLAHSWPLRSLPWSPCGGPHLLVHGRPDRYDSAVLRSGLIIEVPEAETAVAAWRERLDPQAALGVPAHITVLFPFAAPDRLDGSPIATLSRLVATTASFEFHLTRTAWFGDTTLWLAPEPAAPFKQLTQLLSGAFPAYPPYAGQFDDVVPHLTIGDHGAQQQFLDAERDMQQHLPISATARAISLMVERSDRRWERLTAFPLATSR